MAGSRLQREIGQGRPFESRRLEAYLNLSRTWAVVAAPFRSLFREHGLSESTYNVLRILRGAGKPVPSREIGRRLVTRVPDVTRLVDRLEREGLVSRTRSDEDRRVIQVALTRRGLALVKRLDAPVRRLHRATFPTLTEKEVRELIGLLEKSRTGEEDSPNRS